MSNYIPLSVPNFIGNEKKYVDDVIEREWVSSGGKEIDQFENRLAEYLKVKGAVACQSGTAGLHLAYKLAGIVEDSEVIVPSLTFIASVNPIRYINAEPIFMDCDDTLNMDVDKLEHFLANECKMTTDGLLNLRSDKIVKAIVIVHIFGNIMSMEKIMELSKKYKLKVIEDATEALGSYYTEGKYANLFAGTVGDFGVYSFNGNKIITTGGGGMIVSKDENMLDKAKYLSTQAKDDPIYYLHNEIGYNYRMTNIQAALGLAQLEMLEKFILKKSENLQYYMAKVSSIEGLSLLDFNKFARNNCWFYTLLIDEDIFGFSRDEIIKELNKNNIQARPIWGLINEQIPYKKNQCYQIEKAYDYIGKVVNLPCSTNLTKKDIDRIVKVISLMKEGR